jgi:hypothetical protein
MRALRLHPAPRVPWRLRLVRVIRRARPRGLHLVRPEAEGQPPPADQTAGHKGKALMPRIRSIKPEFWGDEKMAALDPTTRLVFLGLISLADDAGRLVDNVKTIDGFMFPDTEDSSRDSLEVLATLGRISRYRSVSGQKLIQIANWGRHQKVDNPNKYTLPAPPKEETEAEGVTKSSRQPREDRATASRDPIDTISDQRSTISDQGSTTSDQRPASEGAPAAAGTAAARAPLGGRYGRVREAIPPEHWEALDGLVRACRSPDALLAELEALASGMRPLRPTPTYAHIGQAVSDLVLNGERPTALLIRTYVQRIVREGERAPPAAAEDEFVKAGREIDERRARDKARAHA